MRRDVGRFYLDHLLATAGAPELLARALDRALEDLTAGELDAFHRRLSRIRKSLRLEAGQGDVAAALIRVLTASAKAGRRGDEAGARARLEPILNACRLRPGTGRA